MSGTFRQAWAEIDLGALRRNASELCRLVAPSALCAVVKADAYGHGAADVAIAAIAGGATSLAVATVEEGIALREAGIDAPVLLLSEPPGAAAAEAVAHRVTPTVYTLGGVRAVGEAAAAAARAVGRHGGGEPVGVHIKVDTGMHRVGADPVDLPGVALRAAATDGIVVAGLWTHLAVADDPEEVRDPDGGFTAEQLRRFENARSGLAAAGIIPAVVHVANSAGALAHPKARFDMVRCGIALYGYPPVPVPVSDGNGQSQLEPVMSLKARVALVRKVEAGEGISYGLRYRAQAPTFVAVIPLGYADGVPRRLSEAGAAVLVGGRRRRLAGVVTMDQMMVDCGPQGDVAVGDEAVLLGRQGDEAVDAEEWARLLGTISYEVLCGIGPRVPRIASG